MAQVFRNLNLNKPHCNLLLRLKRFNSNKMMLATQPNIEIVNDTIQSIQKTEEDNVLLHPDYFNVANMFTVKDLFEARVHFGHKEGSLNEYMKPYIFGSRLSHLIIDLDKTAILLRQALNFTAHIAYRDGIILFVGQNPKFSYLIENTAKDVKEYAHTRKWHQGMLTNSKRMFGSLTRLPDLIIAVQSLTTVLEEHLAIKEAAKMTIPSVAVLINGNAKRYFSTKSFIFKDKIYGQYKDTYQFWILEKFRNDDNYITFKGINENTTFLNINSKLNSISNTEILIIISDLKQIKGYSKLLNAISVEINNRMKLMSVKEILECIDIFMDKFPSLITETSWFTSSIKRLNNLITETKLNEHILIQIMFYGSLKKKCHESVKLLKNCLRQINIKNFKVEELSIICTSLYRCGIRLNSEDLLFLKEVLLINLNNSFINSAEFVTIIKTLKHCRSYSDNLFDSIKKFNVINLPLTTQIHCLSYFCDDLYSDVTFLTKRIFEITDKVNVVIDKGEPLRIKEIDNLLWCCSNYCTDEIKNIIENSKIIKFVTVLGLGKLSDKRTDEMLNVLLWLWFLGIKLKSDVYRNVLRIDNIVKIKNSSNFKDATRLNLLLSCIKIEDYHILDENIYNEMDNRAKPKINKYLNKRPLLKDLYLKLQRNKELFNFKEINYDFYVPCLFIAGITCKTVDNKIMSIELLDEVECLRNSENIPIGKMKLKLRLLKHQKIDAVILNQTGESVDWQQLNKIKEIC